MLSLTSLQDIRHFLISLHKCIIVVLLSWFLHFLLLYCIGIIWPFILYLSWVCCFIRVCRLIVSFYKTSYLYYFSFPEVCWEGQPTAAGLCVSKRMVLSLPPLGTARIFYFHEIFYLSGSKPCPPECFYHELYICTF